MRGFAGRLRATWRSLWRSRQLEREMRDEMQFHIQMEADRLARGLGLDPAEARRQAFVRFGGVERFKEEGRSARGLHWIETASLDARLGVRMLIKHRGLTLVGGLAMAVAIAIGATTFEVIGGLLRSALPFAGGERVVAVRYTTSAAGGVDRRVLHTFTAVRDRLTTIEHLGAFRMTPQNLVVANGAPETIIVTEITASAFVVAGTPPLLGRHLLPSDEVATAPPVVVVSHDIWRARLASDPAIVGRTLLLGGVQTTIVGVMPEGFAFPVRERLWTPFRLNPATFDAWRGPDLHLFGRLAPGATLEQAGAELAGKGQKIADAHPDRPERLAPVVLPFTQEHLGLGSDPTMAWLLRAAQILVGVLAMVVAVNLAILLYARTITRLNEIAVRTALGATRRRILSQLFIEALALTTVGAAAGLMLSNVALRQIGDLNRGAFPFWVLYQLTPSTVLYALVLAVLAALIMGVLPGLKVTGRRLSVNLQELNGRTGTRLGSAWTTLIVAQVAVAVALLPAALFLTWHIIRIEVNGPSVAIDRFVVADLSLGGQTGASATLVAERQQAVLSRLRGESGVAAVTFSSAVPGFGPDRRIEFDPSVKLREAGVIDAAAFRVAGDLLPVYGTRLLAGRHFDGRDTSASGAVIVNRTFAELLEQPGQALGIRFREVSSNARRDGQDVFQVIGVVDDFPGFPRDPGAGGEPTIYFPVAPGEIQVAVLSVRYDGVIPPDVADRLRQAAADVDPSLQLRRIVPLSQFYLELRAVWRSMAWAVGFVTLSVLLLSGAGVQAVMSFTIAQRTREIGIRSALGAPPRHLLLGIFGRAFRQLSIGVAVGSVVSIVAFVAVGVNPLPAVVLLLTVAAVMTIVAALAAIGPARRSLRVQTTEALRMEG